ncbi:hypothetical protein [Limnohabitans sp. DM1]|uniref:hypothetical protein n=1 Tax=Limnohabitans sp. DM1 TaxID=1597955 RepID=UPI000B1BDC68|nr:hypothetical protein [Limnohabitans sp. DM1]
MNAMLSTIETSDVKKSLLTEMTTFGVDDWLFVINLEIFLVLAVGLRIHSWFVMTVVLHMVLMVVTKFQPRVLFVYIKYVRQSAAYGSWLGARMNRGHRPQWLMQGRGI